MELEKDEGSTFESGDWRLGDTRNKVFGSGNRLKLRPDSLSLVEVATDVMVAGNRGRLYMYTILYNDETSG